MSTRLVPFIVILSLGSLVISRGKASDQAVDRFGVFETSFAAANRYENPYTELEAIAEIRGPDGRTVTTPLFWDGDNTWKLRFSPDKVGKWSFRIHSRDSGLDGQRSSFSCTASNRHGSIKSMDGFPRHFQYQDGRPMWFMGDTAWALFTDNKEEKHDRRAAEAYLRTRASQGFNVVHSMLLAESGWGNAGGDPFHDITDQELNPDYWREVDHRVHYANEQGIVVGLVLAWADKRKQEPFAWRRFPGIEARKRYARYIAARYSAFAVYFLVSGEWHAEVRTRPMAIDKLREEFIAIGNSLAEADPHDRMIGIHPMTQNGSVREYNEAPWMSFGDYQQNYNDVHGRILQSRRFGKPVVNSEYGYYLRDRDGDGVPDKGNSCSLDAIRHASWDIVMAGGYLVTGFGTTYFGGNRDPGPFDLEAAKNNPWEQQLSHMKQFFEQREWWELSPHDDWLSCDTPRSKDRRELGRVAPPASTYWLLCNPEHQYLVYSRGVEAALSIVLHDDGAYRAELFNPRTGASRDITVQSAGKGVVRWTPLDAKDWVLCLEREGDN